MTSFIIQWHFFGMLMAWIPWFLIIGGPIIVKIISDNNNSKLREVIEDLKKDNKAYIECYKSQCEYIDEVVNNLTVGGALA